MTDEQLHSIIEGEPGVTLSAPLEQEAGSTPVVALVQHLLQQAATDGAEEVFFEHGGADFVVSFLVGGRRYQMASRPPLFGRLVIARLCALARAGRIRCGEFVYRLVPADNLPAGSVSLRRLSFDRSA